MNEKNEAILVTEECEKQTEELRKKRSLLRRPEEIAHVRHEQQNVKKKLNSKKIKTFSLITKSMRTTMWSTFDCDSWINMTMTFDVDFSFHVQCDLLYSCSHLKCVFSNLYDTFHSEIHFKWWRRTYKIKIIPQKSKKYYEKINFIVFIELFAQWGLACYFESRILSFQQMAHLTKIHQTDSFSPKILNFFLLQRNEIQNSM